MLGSLYNGVSGIKTHGNGIDVTANNISNVNNVGFKGARAEFKSIFYQNVASSGYFQGANQRGMGARMQTTALNIKQGSLMETGRNFDLAIGGKGYFRTMGQNGEIYYTRKGSFVVDKSGFLTTNSGEYVMGNSVNFDLATLNETTTKKFMGENAYTPRNSSLNLSQNTGKIYLPKNLYLPPEPTTSLSYTGSLDPTPRFEKIWKKITQNDITLNPISPNISGKIDDPDTKAGENVKIKLTDANGNVVEKIATLNNEKKYALNDLKLGNFDLTKPIKMEISALKKELSDNKKVFQTDVFSPNGTKNLLKLTISKKEPFDNPLLWSIKAELFSPNGKLISSTNGEMKFSKNGALLSNSLGTLDNEGAGLSVNLGSPATAPNGGFDGIVLSANDSKKTSVSKNGYAQGFFEHYNVNDNGSIFAIFDNSKSIEVAKIPLFHFQNEQGLSSIGGTKFAQSPNSGEAFLYTNQKGEIIQGAMIKSRFLENSNVDLSEALTELIVLQKGFDASAKSITTSNEMLKTAIGLKR